MNVLLVYGSTASNTQFLSNFVKLGLEDAGHQVTVRNVKGMSAADFTVADMLVLGSSTWNIDKLQGQLQHDWRPVYEQFVTLDLQQKPVGVFGVGHYHYTFTAAAANILAEGVKKANGRLIEPVFKVDDVVDLFAEDIRKWAQKLA